MKIRGTVIHGWGRGNLVSCFDLKKRFFNMKNKVDFSVCFYVCLLIVLQGQKRPAAVLSHKRPGCLDPKENHFTQTQSSLKSLGQYVGSSTAQREQSAHRADLDKSLPCHTERPWQAAGVVVGEPNPRIMGGPNPKLQLPGLNAGSPIP